MLFGSLAWFGLNGFAPAQASQSVAGLINFPPPMNRTLNYTVVDGKYTDGPFAGYWAESPPHVKKIEWTEAEWREKLTDEQFRILRSKGTEAPFCSPFLDNKLQGTYHVVGTMQPVFRTDAKFDSGTGWPSFFQPVDADAIWLRPDYSHGMARMEVLSSWDDGHLGHVFEDGPRNNGGLRFCINGEVLVFVESER